MPDQPLVSIIIPTFNRAHLLGETLDSVLAQTYPNWECLVVDDGSTDGTAELLNHYIAKDSRFQYHKRPDSHLAGGNGARNYGFELSTGDYIQWFDDDDVMLVDFLVTKVNCYTEETHLVISSCYQVDSHLSNLTRMEIGIKWSLYKDYVLWRLKIVTNSIMFKRGFLENKSLFNPLILRGQEAEFFARLFFKLPKTHYYILNEPLFLYRQHDATKTALNKDYKPDFKQSEIYVACENLKRALLVNDAQLVQYFYRLLIHFFFRGLEHHDIKNTKYVLQELVETLKSVNWFLVLQLQIIGQALLFQKRGYYKLEVYFKTYTIT